MVCLVLGLVYLGLFILISCFYLLLGLVDGLQDNPICTDTFSV